MSGSYTDLKMDIELGRRRKCYRKTWTKVLLSVLVILLIVAFLQIFLIVPLIFMYSFAFQEALMFTRFGLTTDPNAFNPDPDTPGVRNFHVNVKDQETDEIISLGVWHMLPWIVTNETINEEVDYFNLLRNAEHKVVVVFHGTGETRLDSFKISIVLRYFFHVFVFDYRGYGDSTKGKMSEEAVVSDCVQFYKWVTTKTKAEIYLWGHSLGASLALHTAKILRNEGVNPEGIILEAAFTSMYEEIPYHPYGKIFSWLPYFNSTIRKPLLKNGFRFDNVEYIRETTVPVLMFHAEDDSVIPLALGKKLYNAALMPDRKTVFIQVPRIYGCDHFWLYLYPDLPAYIEYFVYPSLANSVRDFTSTNGNDNKSMTETNLKNF